MANFSSYEIFLQRLQAEDLEARLILQVQHQILQCAKADLFTGQGLHSDLLSCLELLKINAAGSLQDAFDPEDENAVKDRLTRIEQHVHEALYHLFNQPQLALRREHIMLPFKQVREFDTASISWLSKRPGITLRQKLTLSPTIKALNKRWVLDTAENQLLKAFVQQYSELLELKHQSLSVLFQAQNSADLDAALWQLQTEKELLELMEHWLGLDEVREIRPWRNLPPNNTLLSSRYYRRIWDAWTWIRNLDEDIARDCEKLPCKLISFLMLQSAAFFNTLPHLHWVQIPCLFHMRSLRVTWCNATSSDDTTTATLSPGKNASAPQAHAKDKPANTLDSEFDSEFDSELIGVYHGKLLRLSSNIAQRSLQVSWDNELLSCTLHEPNAEHELWLASIQVKEGATLLLQQELDKLTKLTIPGCLCGILSALAQRSESANDSIIDSLKDSDKNAVKATDKDLGQDSNQAPDKDSGNDSDHDSEKAAPSDSSKSSAQGLIKSDNVAADKASNDADMAADNDAASNVNDIASNVAAHDFVDKDSNDAAGNVNSNAEGSANNDGADTADQESNEDAGAVDKDSNEAISAINKQPLDPSDVVQAETIKQASIPDELLCVELSGLHMPYATAQAENQVQFTAFKALAQVWPCLDQTNDEVLIDCANAQAVMGNRPLLTWQSIYQHDASSEQLINTLSWFFEHLANALPAHCLWGLVPDSVAEFALSDLRRQMFLQFKNSQTLPRSIGAAFEFSRTHLPLSANQPYLLLVIALFGSDVEITPLLGYKQPQLLKSAPLGHGWLWVRHPTMVYSLEELGSDATALLSSAFAQSFSDSNLASLDLESLGSSQHDLDLVVKAPPAVAATSALASKSALTSDPTPSDSVSEPEPKAQADLAENSTSQEQIQTTSANSWMVLNWPQIQTPLKLPKLADKIQDVYTQLHKNNPKLKGLTCEVIRTTELLPAMNSNADLDSDSKVVINDHGVVHCVSGAQFLHCLQRLAPQECFWKDHLPELILRVQGHDYSLVKPVQVKPVLKQTVQISDNIKVTLPANCQKYHFKLLRTQGTHLLKFMATITSSQFPLVQDVECTLDLTYTYGAEEPYCLIFKPKNGLKDLPVTWDLLSHLPMHWPNYPQPRAWNQVESDKVNLCLSNFKKINSILERCINFEDFYQTWQNIDGTINLKRLFIWNRAKIIGCWSEGRHMDSNCPSELQQQVLTFFELTNKLQLATCSARKVQVEFLRLVASLSDDLPSTVVQAFVSEMDKIAALFETAETELADGKFARDKFAGSDFKGDEPFDLNSHQFRDCLALSDVMGYVVGSADTLPTSALNQTFNQQMVHTWQRKVLDKMLACLAMSLKLWQTYAFPSDNSSRPYGLWLITHNLLRSVNIALWRHESLLESLSREQVLMLSHFLSKIFIEFLTQKFEKLIALEMQAKSDRSRIYSKNSPRFSVQVSKLMGTCLELLLCLLRTRGIQSLADIWAADSDLVSRMECPLFQFKEKFKRYQYQHQPPQKQIRLKSYLKLNLDGQATATNFDEEPLLLRCAQIYLCGEESSFQIKVDGVLADDDEDKDK